MKAVAIGRDAEGPDRRRRAAQQPARRRPGVSPTMELQGLCDDAVEMSERFDDIGRGAGTARSFIIEYSVAKARVCCGVGLQLRRRIDKTARRSPLRVTDAATRARARYSPQSSMVMSHCGAMRSA